MTFARWMPSGSLCMGIMNFLCLFIIMMHPGPVKVVCPASQLYNIRKMCTKFEKFIKEFETIRRKYNIFRKNFRKQFNGHPIIEIIGHK